MLIEKLLPSSGSPAQVVCSDHQGTTRLAPGDGKDANDEQGVRGEIRAGFKKQPAVKELQSGNEVCLACLVLGLSGGAMPARLVWTKGFHSQAMRYA
eukprot:1157274-Pelagomonas_calceolata.AAC.3